MVCGVAGAKSDMHLHIYCADPEAVLQKALAAGATQIHPVTLKDDGDARGGFRDANGTHWWVARQR
ncbi:MAG: hypothetical protein AAFV96_03725 [Pseudomonadota bacterium]